MASNNINFSGLTDAEVLASREKSGANKLVYKKENSFLDAVKSIVKEPMIILLFVAAIIYFISGKPEDAIFLSVAIVLVAAISLYQDSRSRNALEKLKTFIKPASKVIRNNQEQEIDSQEIVVGDYLIVEEGTVIAADAVIVQSNDFSVNESILTGESMPVSKDKSSEDNKIYLGCTVAGGLAIAKVTAVGNETKLGKIGKSIESIDEEKTPLEMQIRNFVRKMVIAGAVVFIIVWGINYFLIHDVIDSLLKALTLAMSILPEEIPVAFSTFMALGAWRLMKMGIVVKQMKTVETLGSATVICVDKTGTITENKMSLARVYDFTTDKITDAKETLSDSEKQLIRISMFASEPIPFDAMEVALHEAYQNSASVDERQEYKMSHEYPLSGKPPMMTHVFENNSGKRIVAAKGAPEAIMNVCVMTVEQKEKVGRALTVLGRSGYRLLGVGQSELTGINFPETQQEISFTFKGIVAFYDPPKENISEVLKNFYKAGIGVKIITGDNAETTAAIAGQIGFVGAENFLSGDELLTLSETELKQKVSGINMFTRMFPEAKLRVINALKSNNEIVAMTGDGVNDGPALKAAHIGIAMGKKGTEIAKQAASLILVEDDLSKMVDAVAMGRKIYANLKKAIQYIISIHIPIILTVFIPLALGWIYPNIFSPVHIIFLELIMGPTCSIIYENEPMEKNTMSQKPRPFSNTFFNLKELATSIVQGLAITVGTLFIYRFGAGNSYDENSIRTMVFIVLISANIFLTLINRSFYYSVLTTLRYKNNLVPVIIFITVLITCLLLYIPALATFFDFQKLNLFQTGISILAGFLSVIWYELVKWRSRAATVQN
ncbi:MAG: cation-translocating P-type ATPase [Bacteroidetes bacterium]|nr:cation-translocating P-type ATPase [Bacteroidota bacterium]